MEIILNLLKEIFMPIFITLITIELTTMHNKKIEKENFKIKLYYVYEDFRILLVRYYEGIFNNYKIPLQTKDNLNYQEILAQFNIFIPNSKPNQKLTLKKTKALFDFIYDIDLLKERFFSEYELFVDEREDAKLIQSSLDKIYYFLDDESIDKIELFSKKEIDNLKKLAKDMYNSQSKL